MTVVLKVKLLRTQFTNLSQVGVGFALTRTFQEHVYLFLLFFYVFILMTNSLHGRVRAAIPKKQNAI